MEQLREKDSKFLLSKVPEVTIFFWIIKILCTTVGETFSDFLNINLGIGLLNTTVVMGIVFSIVLFVQVKSKRYIPGIYWLTVVLISVFGTLVTDNLTDGLGVPLEWSTIVFSILLGLTFLFWYFSEKTLSIHSIFTVKREVFYWLTILFTFALGTAVGDLYSEQLGLGYLNTGIAVFGVIAASFLAWKVFNINSMLAFWIAYIFTRPLGASLGDYLSQPSQYGGLGFGTTITSIIFLTAILAVIIYLAVSKVDRVGQTEGKNPIRNNERTGAQTAISLVIMMTLGFGSYVALNQRITTTANVSGSTFTDELKTFTSIENNMLLAVNNKDFSTSKTQADNLEHQWDVEASKLKKMDKAAWSEIDQSIDAVLASNRSSNPDVAKCKETIQESLKVMGNY